MGNGISVVLYCRDEAAGKEALPSRANALQARREASDFWQSLLLKRTKNLLSLPSLAAQLRAFLVPFTLHPQVAAKKKAQPGMVLASPVGFTWGFFPFCQVRCRSPHKTAPQGRGDCSLRSQTPLAAAPRWGLPARYLCLPTKCPSLWRFSRLCFCGVIVCVPRRNRLAPINIYPSIEKTGGIPTVSP